MGRLIFDESEWDLLGTKTERQQLTVFQISIRLGATGYQLVECRHRRPPFSTFYSLRDPGLRPTLEGAKLCTHDPYTENHMLYYKSLDNQMSQLELRGGLLTAKTDSSSTERAHSKTNAGLGSEFGTYAGLS